MPKLANGAVEGFRLLLERLKFSQIIRVNKYNKSQKHVTESDSCLLFVNYLRLIRTARLTRVGVN